jgi:hypothetical protein
MTTIILTACTKKLLFSDQYASISQVALHTSFKSDGNLTGASSRLFEVNFSNQGVIVKF